MTTRKISEIATQVTALASDDRFEVSQDLTGTPVTRYATPEDIAAYVKAPTRVTVLLDAQDVYDAVDAPLELLPAPGAGFLWLPSQVFMHLAPDSGGAMGDAPSGSKAVVMYGAVAAGASYSYVGEEYFPFSDAGRNEDGDPEDLLLFANQSKLSLPSPLGRTVRARMPERNDDYDPTDGDDDDNQFPALAFDGPVSLVGSPQLGWREPTGAAVDDGGSGYTDDTYWAEYTDATTGRKSRNRVAVTTSGGAVVSVDSIQPLDNENGIWPEHVAETYTLDGGDGNATITFSGLASYTPMDFGTGNKLVIDIVARRMRYA